MSRASTAVQNLAALLPLPYINMNSAQGAGLDSKAAANQAQIVETNVDEPPAIYDIPQPRTAFSAFVDHPDEFVRFLEACVNSEEVKQADKASLYTTLFEIYLHIASNKKGDDKAEWEQKAKKLIEDRDVC